MTNPFAPQPQRPGSAGSVPPPPPPPPASHRPVPQHEAILDDVTETIEYQPRSRSTPPTESTDATQPLPHAIESSPPTFDQAPQQGTDPSLAAASGARKGFTLPRLSAQTAPKAPKTPVPPEPPVEGTPKRSSALLPQIISPSSTPKGPTGPSPIAETFKALWFAPLEVWKGRPAESLAIADGVRRKTGNSWIFWVITFAINSLLIAVIATVLAAGTSSLMDDLLDFATGGLFVNAMGYSGLSVLNIVAVFLSTVLLSFAALSIRSVTLLWTHRVSGSQASFAQVATSFAAAQTIFTLPLTIVMVLSLVRSLPLLALLVMIVWIGLTIMAEIFIYVGILQSGQHRYSAIVPFAWFWVLAAGLTVVAGTAIMMAIAG